MWCLFCWSALCLIMSYESRRTNFLTAISYEKAGIMGAVQSTISLTFLNSMWQTDRQTDRQTYEIVILTVWRPLLTFMGTAIKHPVPARVKPSFVILTSGHSDAQSWASECTDVKITNDGLTWPVWHRMPYSCTHMATVGVKGLSVSAVSGRWYVLCCSSSVMIDSSRSFGPDPLFFDYIVREVDDSSQVHIVPARKLRSVLGLCSWDHLSDRWLWRHATIWSRSWSWCQCPWWLESKFFIRPLPLGICY